MTSPSPETPPAADQHRPSRSRTTLVVALVLGLVAVAGLAGAGAWWLTRDDEEPAREARVAPEPPEPTGTLPAAPSGLERFYDQELAWEECGSFECADLTVPLDYAEPDGETLEVAVLRVPARDRANRVGQLVINPGGPGGSGTEAARLGSLLVGSDLSRSFDVVGFDPRGTGETEPITCSTESLDEVFEADPSPDDQGEVDAMTEAFRDLGESCVETSGEITQHASTVETARDMDVLRQALGEPALDYLGFSYGTKLGATYAQLFPQQVGQMVLDGAVGPDLGVGEAALAQAGGFQTAFDSYLADCIAQGDCPLGGSVAEGRDAMSALIEDRDADPLPTGSDRELGSGLAYTGVVSAMYTPQAWPVLTDALRQAQDGDGKGLLALADAYSGRGPDGYRTNLIQAFYAISCLDGGDSSIPADEVPEYFAEFDEASPTFGRSFVYSYSMCEDWPAEQEIEEPRITGAGAPPIVVVGTTRDSATPYQGAVDLAAALEQGVLVTRDGDGHTGFNKGNACVDDAIVAFFMEEEVPEDGLRC